MPTTERLTITPLRPDDAAELFAALDHPEVGRFIGGPEADSPAAWRARIERVNAGPPATRPDERWWNFAVRRTSDDVLLGRIEATTYVDWAEIAYVLDPREWGQGFATEATSWLLEFLAEHGVTQVWAAVLPDNVRSVQLLRRLSFVEREHPHEGMGSFDDGDLVFARSLGGS